LEEIKRRIIIGKYMLLRHAETEDISITKEKTKCQLYKTIILSTVLCGSESWALSKAHEALLGGYKRILRKIYGAVQIDGVWRRRYLLNVYIIKKIKINTLRWAGHAIR
jgi:hypothetical protein